MQVRSPTITVMNDYHGPLGGAPGPSPYPGRPAAPPYGAPYGQSPQPPPSAADIRPRKRWIFFGWLFFVVTLAAGIAVFVSGIVSTIDGLTPQQTFGNGGSASVAITPAERPVIWVHAPERADVSCRTTNADGSGQYAELNRVRGSQTLDVDGKTWEAVFEISVPAAGTYQTTCSSPTSGVTFAVGQGLAETAGEAVSAVAALIVLPLVGFIVAVIVTVVVLVRRSGARKRLAAGGWPHA